MVKMWSTGSRFPTWCLLLRTVGCQVMAGRSNNSHFVNVITSVLFLLTPKSRAPFTYQTFGKLYANIIQYVNTHICSAKWSDKKWKEYIHIV